MTKMWEVHRNGCPVLFVEADYVVIDQGHALFRNSVRGHYPQLVHAIAPGTWREVKEHGTTQHERTKATREAVRGCFYCSG